MNSPRVNHGDPRLTRVEFRNFKALEHFSMSLRHMNLLVGPNNAGKSTLLGAFRVLASAISKARTRKPDYRDPDTLLPGYFLTEEQIPIGVENVGTNYSDAPSWVRFYLSSGYTLTLNFFGDRSCALIPDAQGKQVRDTVGFKSLFPITIGDVPPLGPVEQEELVLDESTVRRGIRTHRAPRYFRNYWWHYQEGFEGWRERVRVTWPGMDIALPEIVHGVEKPRLTMMCKEDRFDRELNWIGSGFQVWCQILTHIERSKSSSLLLVDEPEIYLHPEVQRQLLGLLREAGPAILIATHSSEILGEAEPSEVLLVDKRRRSARRLSTSIGIHEALTSIGSLHATSLQQIARTQRVLFVEGGDFKIISEFARAMGMPRLAARADLEVIELHSFPTVEQVKAACLALKGILRAGARFAGVFDRDSRCAQEVGQLTEQFGSVLKPVEVLERKEIENYLLVPIVLDRAIERAVTNRAQLSGKAVPTVTPAEEILRAITEAMRNELRHQFAGSAIKFLKRTTGRDEVTILRESGELFDENWADFRTRLMIVPGKQVLARLNAELQTRYKIELSSRTIAQAFLPEEVPSDFQRLLKKLDQFRASDVKSSRELGSTAREPTP